jgi:predicted methyltransferase
MINDLVSRVFNSRNNAHLSHWKTKSYAQHMALGDFYVDTIESIDSLVEAFQGMFDLISVKELPCDVCKDITQCLEDDLVWFSENRTKITKGSEMVDNLLQELEHIYSKTLYKLHNLS